MQVLVAGRPHAESGVVSVAQHPRTDILEDSGLNGWIRVVPVVVQSVREDDTQSVASRAVERQLVKLAVEPAFDRIRADIADLAEITLIEPRTFAARKPGILRVVADATDHFRRAVDQVFPLTIRLTMDVDGVRSRQF